MIVQCYHCKEPIDGGGVRLSEFAVVHDLCYEALMAAWQEEAAKVVRLPTPKELHRRIAEERHRIGNEPRNVMPSAVGSNLYQPKKVAYRSARRGNEARDL